MSSKANSSTSGAGVRVKEVLVGALGTESDSIYDMKSAVWLTFILSFLLCWIPILGQMVAGYIGGRRSGSPVRGAMSTTLATVVVLAILMILSVGLFSVNGILTGNPGERIDEISGTSPLTGQMLSAGLSYLTAAFGSVDGTLSINYGIYLVTIAFGFIGGIIADQSRKETRLIISESASTAPVRSARSMEMHRAGRSLGFETFDDIRAANPRAQPEVQSARIVEVPKAAPVTATTVGPVRAGMTTTSNTEDADNGPFSDILRRQDRKDPSEQRAQQKDDFEYI